MPITFLLPACLESVSGQEYRGTVSVSRRGKKCQRWTSQIPHRHRYNTRHFFPDRSLEESSNFCRNPDDTGGTAGVWCYTTDLHVRWDFCDVPYCSGVVPTTTLGIKIPTTTQEPTTSTLSSQYTGRPEETLAKGGLILKIVLLSYGCIFEDMNQLTSQQKKMHYKCSICAFFNATHTSFRVIKLGNH